jgi:capsular exopolysaccharide synthesis family protein
MLASSLARARTRLIAVDLDLRHPDLHNRVGGHNDVGVSEILRGKATLQDCVQEVGSEDAPFYFVAAGAMVPNPTELLGTTRAHQMLDSLARTADLVLVDTPPVLPVADTLVIGRLAAGALLVVEAGRTPTPALLKVRAALVRNQTRLLGAVLNRYVAPGGALAVDGYGYGYGPQDVSPNES